MLLLINTYLFQIVFFCNMKKPYNNKGGRRSGSRRPQGEGKGQGQNQENREGGEKKPYVFRQNSNREEGENRRRQPRKDSYKGERRQEEKAASNDNIRSEVPRSTPPRMADAMLPAPMMPRVNFFSILSPFYSTIYLTMHCIVAIIDKHFRGVAQR